MKDTVIHIIKTVSVDAQTPAFDWTFWTLLSTVVLFIVGYCLNWIIKKWEKKKEYESFNQTVINWVDNCVPEVKKLIQSIEIYIKDCEKPVNFQPTPFAIPTLQISKLNELDLEKHIKVFILNRKADSKLNSTNIYNIISQIDYINTAYNEIYKFHNEGKTQYTNLMNEYNELLPKITYLDENFLIKLRELVDLCLRSKGDISVDLKNLISSSFEADKQKQEQAYNLGYQYFKIVKIDYGYHIGDVKYAEMYKDRLEQSLAELEKSVNRFRDFKLKSWYKMI